MLYYLLSVLGLVPTFQKTKCKRLLNTTMERIKLLEKRHQARLRQLQRDVIELLQRRKENKVQPWLERIWKELCLFSVYIKVAEYCQFVQINLKDIAGQRECPSCLEEPLAGLCFAASCCADLPELQELREIFSMKYGKQLVDSSQELQPNCHVNQQFLECLCAKGPSETRKQELLEEITTQYNVKQGHEQDAQQQEIQDCISTESFVDAANECNQSQEGIDDTMKASEVEDQSEDEVSNVVDLVHESNRIESVCEEDLGCMELANELANRKRTLEDRETCGSAFKRAYRRRKFWLNKAMEEEEDGGEEHEKTAGKVHDCVDEGSTMTNFIGSHVHPRLPKYEDLVANFTALKQH